MIPDDLAQLPVARRRYDHFTTLDGATFSATATCRTLCPSARRASARSRKSIEIGRVIAQASLVVATTVNQLRPNSGIPIRFKLSHLALGDVLVLNRRVYDSGDVL